MRVTQPVEIITLPDSRLRQPSSPVAVFDTTIDLIIQKLIYVLERVDKKHLPIDALGMAAPQVGYNQKIIGIRDGGYGKFKFLINPEIVEQRYVVPVPETCYSVPGVHWTKRYLWIKIRYQNASGQFHEHVFKGVKAIVVQQEVDHINGKLISDF